MPEPCDSRFAACLVEVLNAEGGYVDNPHDRGGATNYGITQRIDDAYRRAKGLPPASVRDITLADVRLIYRQQYWAAVSGDRLPAGIDLCLFDEAVNSGPSRAIRDLQAALGVAPDGHFGLITQTALAEFGDRTVLVDRLSSRRLGLLRRLAGWRFFGRGWSRRVAAVRAAALAMAAA